MELDEFIRKSLLQILRGIKDAQVESVREGPGTGVINPKWGSDKDHYDYVSEVEFDVAISAGSSKAGGGKATLQVLSFEVGGRGEAKIDRSTVSRVAFRLPVAFPGIIVTDVVRPKLNRAAVQED